MSDGGPIHIAIDRICGRYRLESIENIRRANIAGVEYGVYSLECAIEGGMPIPVRITEDTQAH